MKRILFHLFFVLLIFTIGVSFTELWLSKIKLFDNPKLQILHNTKSTFEFQTEGKTTFQSISQNKEVSLQIAEISWRHVSFELANRTNKPIYLAYSHSRDSETGFVYYNMRCKGKGDKKYQDYSIHSHVVPTIDPLEKENNIHFQTFELPKTQAICKISVGYYEGEKIAKLLNDKILNLSKSEKSLIERSKRFVELTFHHK